MPTSTDLSFIHLITNASLLVQLVMLALLIASVISWTMIFNKRLMLNKAKRETNEFEERFWSLEDLTPLYTRVSHQHYSASGMEKIFEAGFKEFARLRKQESIEAEARSDGKKETNM